VQSLDLAAADLDGAVLQVGKAPVSPPARRLMAVHAGLLRTSTPGSGAVVDLTEGHGDRSPGGVQHGVVTVFASGATVAVTTIEHEPGAVADLQALLDRLIPAAAEYEHNARNHDTNAHAHLRAALIGPSESIRSSAARSPSDLQQVVLLDFDDRPRDRAVTVHVVS